LLEVQKLVSLAPVASAKKDGGQAVDTCLPRRDNFNFVIDMRP